MGVEDGDRMTIAQVARRYGVAPRRVKPLTDAGEIPYLRIEEYVRSDGRPATRYVYSLRVIEAALRRAGELHAERSAS